MDDVTELRLLQAHPAEKPAETYNEALIRYGALAFLILYAVLGVLAAVEVVHELVSR